MRKFFIVLALVTMFLTVSTYASCFQNQTFVKDDSYVYYQVVPKVVKVKTTTKVTKVIVPGPVKIVPNTVLNPAIPVRILRPTPWVYNSLSSNINITWDIVKSNPDKLWNYLCLSENPNITWENVQEKPDKHWDYGLLSKNPSITWDIIQENPHISWSYYSLSENPNITWDIVCDNLNKQWNYDMLSANKMYKHPFFQNKQLSYVLK
jgi:hypothetical protein